MYSSNIYNTLSFSPECTRALRPLNLWKVESREAQPSVSASIGKTLLWKSLKPLSPSFLLQKQQSCPNLARLALHCHFSLKQPRLKERIWKTEKLIWRCGFIAINFARQNQHALIITSYKKVRDTHLQPPRLRVGPRRSFPLYIYYLGTVLGVGNANKNLLNSGCPSFILKGHWDSEFGGLIILMTRVVLCKCKRCLLHTEGSKDCIECLWSAY